MIRIAFGFCLMIVLLSGTVANAEQTWRRDGATAIGKVQISAASDISALRGISMIKGDLVILNYPGADLRGLQSLTYVAGAVTIFGNPKLSSLAGLERLEIVDGRLSISSNPRLQSLGALRALRAVKTGVDVVGNAALVELFSRGLRIGEPIHKRKGFLQISGNRKLGDTAAETYARTCTLEGRITVSGNRPPARRR